MKSKNTWFSIIEVMIWLFVFALWLTSIFMMLSGSITMSDYSRNLIIASNLASEQVELYKNIRDSNYKKVKSWTQVQPNKSWVDVASDPHWQFMKDRFYKIENNYNVWADFPILVNHETPLSDIWDDSLELPSWIEKFQLCMDSIWRYTYDCSGSNTKTPFYRFLYLSDAVYEWSTGSIEWAFRITSKVIWAKGSKFETEISTIVTDWKKL